MQPYAAQHSTHAAHHRRQTPPNRSHAKHDPALSRLSQHSLSGGTRGGQTASQRSATTYPPRNPSSPPPPRTRLSRAHLAVVCLSTLLLPTLTSAQPDGANSPAPELSPLLVTPAGRPITSPDQWPARRAQLEQQWTDLLGSIDIDQPPPQLTVIRQDHPAGVIRTLVRYEAEPGIPVDAYLLRPAAPPAAQAPPHSRPGVLVLHPTTERTINEPAGVDNEGPRAFALDLARRGFVTLCPTNYLWVGPGPYNRQGFTARADLVHQRHPGATGMAKMLYDARRALDALAAQPDVDPKRLGAIGHSLGAKEALYLAAFDPRIAAAVSHEGGLGLSMSNWSDPWYLGDQINAPGFAHDHHELLALIAPRPFLVMGGGSADTAADQPWIDAALPVFELLDPRTPPNLKLILHDAGHTVTPFVAQTAADFLTQHLHPEKRDP